VSGGKDLEKKREKRPKGLGKKEGDPWGQSFLLWGKEKKPIPKGPALQGPIQKSRAKIKKKRRKIELRQWSSLGWVALRRPSLPPEAKGKISANREGEGHARGKKAGKREEKS